MWLNSSRISHKSHMKYLCANKIDTCCYKKLGTHLLSVLIILIRPLWFPWQDGLHHWTIVDIVIIGLGNGMTLVWHQAITWTNGNNWKWKIITLTTLSSPEVSLKLTLWQLMVPSVTATLSDWESFVFNDLTSIGSIGAYCGASWIEIQYFSYNFARNYI